MSYSPSDRCPDCGKYQDCRCLYCPECHQLITCHDMDCTVFADGLDRLWAMTHADE